MKYITLTEEINKFKKLSGIKLITEQPVEEVINGVLKDVMSGEQDAFLGNIGRIGKSNIKPSYYNDLMSKPVLNAQEESVVKAINDNIVKSIGAEKFSKIITQSIKGMDNIESDELIDVILSKFSPEAKNEIKSTLPKLETPKPQGSSNPQTQPPVNPQVNTSTFVPPPEVTNVIPPQMLNSIRSTINMNDIIGGKLTYEQVSAVENSVINKIKNIQGLQKNTAAINIINQSAEVDLVGQQLDNEIKQLQIESQQLDNEFKAKSNSYTLKQQKMAIDAQIREKWAKRLSLKGKKKWYLVALLILVFGPKRVWGWISSKTFKNILINGVFPSGEPTPAQQQPNNQQQQKGKYD